MFSYNTNGIRIATTLETKSMLEQFFGWIVQRVQNFVTWWFNGPQRVLTHNDYLIN
jgi:hypothetical protein